MAVKVPSFADRLALWRPELFQKERAALLGVPLDTFRGWFYGYWEPRPFVRSLIEEKMQSLDSSPRK